MKATNVKLLLLWTFQGAKNRLPRPMDNYKLPRTIINYYSINNPSQIIRGNFAREAEIASSYFTGKL